MGRPPHESLSKGRDFFFPFCHCLRTPNIADILVEIAALDRKDVKGRSLISALAPCSGQRKRVAGGRAIVRSIAAQGVTKGADTLTMQVCYLGLPFIT